MFRTFLGCQDIFPPTIKFFYCRISMLSKPSIFNGSNSLRKGRPEATYLLGFWTKRELL